MKRLPKESDERFPFELRIVGKEISFEAKLEALHAADLFSREQLGKSVDASGGQITFAQLPKRPGDGAELTQNYEPDVTREEVRQAAAKLLSDNPIFITDLDARFPEETWGNVYPYAATVRAFLDAMAATDASDGEQ